jgi:hypothetical protein
VYDLGNKLRIMTIPASSREPDRDLPRKGPDPSGLDIKRIHSKFFLVRQPTNPFQEENKTGKPCLQLN